MPLWEKLSTKIKSAVAGQGRLPARDRGDVTVTDGLCNFCEEFLVLDLDREPHLSLLNEQGASRIARVWDADHDADIKEYGRRRNFLPAPISDLYPEFPALTASHRCGCTFCGILITQIKVLVSKRTHRAKFPPVFEVKIWRIELQEMTAGNEYVNGLNLKVHVYSEVTHIRDDFCIRIGALDEVAMDYFGFQTDPDFLAGDQIESILKLIQTCIMTHRENLDEPDDSCFGGPAYNWGPKASPPPQEISQGFENRRPGTYNAPRRLVFVGGYPDYPEPRLIDTSELLQMTDVTEGSPHLDLRYIAYSHCWGDPANGPMTTTPETLLQRKSGIPLDTLPRSFQDLILVARKLGIAYVWIDSLCIVQGSHGDFFEQASQMGDIYRSSYLTVISASAKSAHAGFLQRRPKAYMKYNIQELNVQGPLYLEPLNLSLGSLKSECLWAERGWTYQEEYLSVRRLYFFPNNLVYECNSNGWFTEGVGIDRFKQDDSVRVWNSTALTTIGSFSSRNFTKFEDKVAAFAGIAKHMEPSHSPHFLSSPFRSGLDQLWMRSFYGQKDHRIHRNYIVSRSTGSCRVGPDGPKFLTGDPDLHAGVSMTQLAATLLWANTATPAKDHTTETGVVKGPSFSWLTVAAPVSFTVPIRKANETAQMRVHMYGQALLEDHPGAKTFDSFVHADGAFIRGTGMVCPLDKIVHVGPKEANTRVWAWECRERYLEMKIEATLDWRGHSVESDKFQGTISSNGRLFCLDLWQYQRQDWRGIVVEEIQRSEIENDVVLKSLVQEVFKPLPGVEPWPNAAEKVYKRIGVFRATIEKTSRHPGGKYSFRTMPTTEFVDFLLV